MYLINEFPSYNPVPIEYILSSNGKWKITSPITCSLQTKSMGEFTYKIKTGYETDFRSGPGWCEPIMQKCGIPKIGNNIDPQLPICWLIHDA